MKALLLAINSKYIHTALGIRSVSAFCQKREQNVSFLEETIQTPLLAVLAEVFKVQPDLLGIDVHIWNKKYVLELVSLIRQVLPATVIVLGGPEVSFTPAQILTSCSAVDYVIQGEGEEVFCDLLLALNERKAFPKHIAYRSEAGVYVSTPAVIEDLDQLPFAYPDLHTVVEQHRLVYYETTRGCPFSCSYCLSGISRTIRRRSLNMVYEDIEKFVAAGVSLVKFVDRTYNLDESYYLPLLKKLAALDAAITFHLEIKADLLSQRVLDFLSTVPQGRFQMEIGVQTTNVQTLEAVGRQDNWQLLSANVQKILSYGNAHLHLDLIAGLPYEDLVSLKKSFNDTYGLMPHILQLGFLKVLPGSQMQQEADRYSLKYMQDAPYEILSTAFLSYEQMRFLKVFEDVFDHTYNTGAFPNALAYLVHYYADDAFCFYAALTHWWEKQGLYPLGHNIREIALVLLAFANTELKDASEFKERLRFDVFLYQPGYRPDVFVWHQKEDREAELAFWRRKEIVHKYLPTYDFASWRQVRKYLPIERFNWQPGDKYGAIHYVMGDFRKKNASYLTIAEEDFIDKAP